MSTSTFVSMGGGGVGSVGIGIANCLLAANQDKIFVTRDIKDARIVEIIRSKLKN